MTLTREMGKLCENSRIYSLGIRAIPYPMSDSHELPMKLFHGFCGVFFGNCFLEFFKALGTSKQNLLALNGVSDTSLHVKLGVKYSRIGRLCLKGALYHVFEVVEGKI